MSLNCLFQTGIQIKLLALTLVKPKARGKTGASLKAERAGEIDHLLSLLLELCNEFSNSLRLGDFSHFN